MDKFSDNANVFDVQPFKIKEVAEAFAAIMRKGDDGWFTGTCVFQMVNGKVTHVDETKIVKRSGTADPFYEAVAQILRSNEPLVMPPFVEEIDLSGDFTIETTEIPFRAITRANGVYAYYGDNGEPLSEPLPWHLEQIAAIEAAPSGEWHHFEIQKPAE